MLTSECANCPFWRDTETECGCAFPRPIDECKAFSDEYSDRATKKWHSFETLFIGLASALKEFLDNNVIYYEVSGIGKGYHFEILADHFDCQLINGFLDKECIWHEEL